MSIRNAEQKFCTELQKWLKHNFDHPSFCLVEAKVVYDDKPFNFKSGFRPHQLPLLINIQTHPFAYKISDMDRMQKPVDIIYSYRATTLVAIMWVRRGNKTFYLIDPVNIQKLIDSGEKSLKEETAAKMAVRVGELK